MDREVKGVNPCGQGFGFYSGHAVECWESGVLDPPTLPASLSPNPQP